jgi:hypothetical protein
METELKIMHNSGGNSYDYAYFCLLNKIDNINEPTYYMLTHFMLHFFEEFKFFQYKFFTLVLLLILNLSLSGLLFLRVLPYP